MMSKLNQPPKLPKDDMGMTRFDRKIVKRDLAKLNNDDQKENSKWVK